MRFPNENEHFCAMKYRMLTADELVPFEEELKQFLIVNGVHGDEWEQMNRDTPEKAIELVELFSDTVLQKVYEKIEFLEFRSVDSCLVFHCLSEYTFQPNRWHWCLHCTPRSTWAASIAAPCTQQTAFSHSRSDP